jgi:hypothetical protein
MIIASAIKLSDGSVFVGKRHGDCYYNMKVILKLEKPNQCAVKAIQGFINDKLQFLNRENAYYEALENNQCAEQIKPSKERLEAINKMFIDGNPKFEWKPQLASEDLW